jgi:ACT domain-containing protein
MAAMYLVRLELPDRPGALGAVATALGTTGADIVSVDIVERRAGTAVDDFVIDLPWDVTPDALITAGQSVEGVNVHWVARYSAGGDALRDLEAVEAMTTDPVHAAETLTTLAPGVFMGDWALLVQTDAPRGPKRLAGSRTAPDLPPQVADEPWPTPTSPSRILVPDSWQQAGWTDLAVTAPVGPATTQLLVGRSGGPEFLDSELARLGHLANLAVTIGRA